MLKDHSNDTIELISEDVPQVDPGQLEQQVNDQMYYQDMNAAELLPNEPGIGSPHIMRDWWELSCQNSHKPGHVTGTGSETPTWLSNFFAISALSPSGQFNDLGNPASLGGTERVQVIDPNLQTNSTNIDLDLDMIPQNTIESTQWEDPAHPTFQHPSPREISSLKSGDRHSTRGSPDLNRTKFEVQIHRSLSHVLMPPLPQDIYVHEIIERARSNALSRRMLLDAPTLADFLVDNSTNVLSSDLKKYLEPLRRSKRTIEYLGTYWVSYLLLRV